MIVTRCILSCQAVWARCWWAPVSRWPRLHLRAQHHPEEQITLSQAVVSLTQTNRINNNKYNFRCVYHSTIYLKRFGRSVLVGEYLGFIPALILSVLSCALLTWDKIDRICHDFLQIQNNEAAVMKSANLLRYKPNWCAMPECWVQCSLAAS